MTATILMNTSRTGRMGRALRMGALTCGLLTAPLMMTGCNDAQAGLLLGSGIGALTGQAIGHDTCSTLLGLGIGASAGYIIGNESDKAKQQYYRQGNYQY